MTAGGWVTVQKRDVLLWAPLSLLLAGMSAWRCLAIFGLTFAGWLTWLAAWLGLTGGFALFWLVTLTAGRQLSGQRLLTAGLGAVGLGLLGLLLATPAGLARLTLELYAEQAWSPTMFRLTWVKDGIWETPFSLPQTGPFPITLEIIAGTAEQAITPVSGPAAGGEIWLVHASQADGRPIPLDEFQPDPGWQRREVDWGAYHHRPVLVAQSPGQTGQPPTVLRWQGQVTGPLTLVFARHPRAGQVTLRWQGQAQTVDLSASTTEFIGVTLPLAGPVVWRATLPLSALQAEEMGLAIEPDPGGGYSTIINKLKLTGLPGQTGELSGADLLELLRVKYGRLTLASTGLQVTPEDPRRPPQLFVQGPWTTQVNWSKLLPPLENGLLILYLAVAGYVGLGSLARFLSPASLTHLNLVALSLIIALAIGEIGLRFYLPPSGKYYVWPPHLHKAFRPDPQGLPGITGESHFIVNSQGIRGDEFSTEDDYRILAIGGSTTECLYLDQSEAWPQLVQASLNEPASATAQAQPGLQVWVGNAGRSGRDTREHILQMKYLLPQYPDLAAVIMLIGFNDLSLGLRLGDDDPNYLTTPGARYLLMQRAFAVLEGQSPLAPYYEQTATWRAASRIWQAQAQVRAAEAIEVEDETGQNYVSRRERRQQGPIKAELPDLSGGLAEYQRNINEIIDLAEAQQVRLILLTQPTLYRSDLSLAEEKLLWMGEGPQQRYFYSARAMAEGIALYNQTLLDICRQRQVECLDLAAAVPKETAMFYDDAHFTEQGARQVAQVVTDYLLSRPPFKGD